MGFKRGRITYLILALFLVTFVAAGCGPKPPSQAESQKVPVEVAKVARGTITQPARVTGTVQAGTTINVTAAMPGKLKAVLVNVGDRVSQGQVIARLDDSDAAARLAQARAGLDQARTAPAQAEAGIKQAEARVKQAEAQASLDAANLQRTQTLFDQGAASQQQLDAARTAAAASQENLAAAQGALEAARAGLAASQAGIATASAAVRQAEVALENTYIKAPADGVVAARLLEPGETAQGPVITLVTTGNLQVEINVTEEDVNYLRPGNKVSVAVPAAGDKTLASRVASVSPAADERTHLYQVKIDLPAAPAEVKPGMAATVVFPTRQAANALLVPKNAVVNRSGQNVVYTVVDGKAAGRAVTTGLDDGKNVEILKGLDDNAVIIVKGQDFVNENQPVEVVNGGPQS
ncbi:efflux RND transporter periplasmic adaptor subunit [Moorella naiadis]|uniref:efflux RND transporter periplasmic adaptor subunit n=1 Tax=Moorella naiadis (nom. illeg.) TaxID=3093670 RepID=UPI003D9CB957